jgi:large subunit ribosomal protein L9
MVKRVQLVLTQDVRKLGRNGDLVDVAPGYARNYLIPKGIGLNVTPGILKQAEKRREIERVRLAELKQVAIVQKDAIDKVGTISIAKQVGERESIFGTVTTAEVAEAIEAAMGQKVDKRDIELPDISKLGTYTAQVELHPEVTVSVTVEVISK